MLAVENMNHFPYPSMETYAPMHYAGYMPAITTLPKPAPRSRPPPKASRVRLTLPKHPDPEDPKPTRQSKRAGPDYQTARAKRAEKKARAYIDTLEGASTAGLRTRRQAENEIGRIMRSVNKTIEEAAAGGCPPPPPPHGRLNTDDEETPESVERKPLKIKIPKSAIVNYNNRVREMDELTSLLGGACAVQENYDIDSLTRVTERSLNVGSGERLVKRVCFEEELQPQPSPMRQMEIEVETRMFLAEMEEQLGMKKTKPSVAAVPLAQPVEVHSQRVDAPSMTVDAQSMAVDAYAMVDADAMAIDVDSKTARKAAYREAKKQARREKQASKKREVQNRRTLRALEGQQQALEDILLDVPSDRVLPVDERLVVDDGRADNKYLVEDTADYNVVGPRRHRLAGRMNASPYGAALAEKRSRRNY